MENPIPAPSLLSYPRYRPDLKRAPFLPMTRAEMDALGWDACDIIVVTGDAYIDHPSFGMALIGRTLEAQGFRVGIVSQPDWHSADAFRALGKPRLFYGITAGNMDSMINRYTADRKPRSDDAYTADALPDKRPDRAVVVYAQRAREAYPDANIVIGSIEASLRRIAHYDHWSEKVKRSVLPDSKADLLIFGSGERATIALAHRLAAGEPIEHIRDLRGTAFMVKPGWHPEGFVEVDSTAVDRPGPVEPHPDPYAMEPQQAAPAADGARPVRIVPAAERVAARKADRARQVVRLPAYEVVKDDKVMYAHASRTFHLESNPGNARAMVQAHGVGPGCRDVWLNPPPIPLTTEEMDWVFGQPYARRPHPAYGEARIPAWDMIRFSINIMRGCFGGCTFCSITEHEGRIIQSRSQESILKEIEDIREKVTAIKDSQDLAALEKNLMTTQASYLKEAKLLSQARKKAAKVLEKSVTDAMQDLSMAGGLFSIQLDELSEGGPYGLEQVEFLVAGHPGVTPKPLAKVASGGELARISLAISVITSEASQIPTLIFDEVDSGIGGAVAETVGKRLKELGQAHQVLCVTHLAQVAAQGHQHWKVSKHSEANTTISQITSLNRQERVEEVARMLGGTEITETTRRHARELLGA